MKEDKPDYGQSAIREVEEDLQSLRNKWIAKGETDSFVEGVLKYAKMISLPVERTDAEIEAIWIK